MRIDKFFSDTGIFSRSQFSEVIRSGKIKVDGKVVLKSDFQLDENKNIVEFDGNIIPYQKYFYCILNKPAGYVTSTLEKNELTVYDILPEYFLRKKIMPVGRLDKETTGLLILTNDGQLTHTLTSPKHSQEKEYTFVLADDITDEEINILASGTVLSDGTQLKECKITMKDNRNGNIIITEGKYHQVRRMFASVGNKVVYLKRVREGNYILPYDLQEGKFIFISKEEIL